MAVTEDRKYSSEFVVNLLEGVKGKTLGTEVHKESKDSDPRIVFELEYLESLPNYLPIDLPIFRTYKDTLLGRVMGDFL